MKFCKSQHLGFEALLSGRVPITSPAPGHAWNQKGGPTTRLSSCAWTQRRPCLGYSGIICRWPASLCRKLPLGYIFVPSIVIFGFSASPFLSRLLTRSYSQMRWSLGQEEETVTMAPSTVRRLKLGQAGLGCRVFEVEWAALLSKCTKVILDNDVRKGWDLPRTEQREGSVTRLQQAP